MTQKLQFMYPLICSHFLWQIFDHILLYFRQTYLIFFLIFFQKLIVRTAFFKNFSYINRTILFEFQNGWNSSKFIFQRLIRFPKQFHIICSGTVNRNIDPFSGNLIKMNRWTSRNNPRAFSDIATHSIFVVTSVTGQSDRYHKVIHVISDKIKNNHILFSFTFSQASAKLLNKYNRWFGWSEHNDLIDFRNVDPLIKYIHGKNIVQLFFSAQVLGKLIDNLFSSLLTVFTCQNRSLVASLIKLLW